jgi:glycosyltransferase involved in cell wall biosynthesis
MVKFGDQPSIDVLISSFNGSNYIEDQIFSILNQRFDSISIIVRDDGSTDSTFNKIKKIARQKNERIYLIKGFSENIGITKSYNILLDESRAQYICLSDQDDVWKKDKMSRSFDAMRKLERIHGEETPILIHTDLTVTDSNLRKLHSSFIKYRGINPHKKELNYLLVQNNVTGCTMMLNKALKERAMPIPEDACVHDWWIALVACLFGVIGYLNHPTVYYRQHRWNRIGAREYGFPYLMKRIIEYGVVKNEILDSIGQAAALYARFKHELKSDQKEQIVSFIELSKSNFIKRKKSILKYRFSKQDILRTIGFVALA